MNTESLYAQFIRGEIAVLRSRIAYETVALQQPLEQTVREFCKMRIECYHKAIMGWTGILERELLS